jgi:hypothetical protein
MLKTRNGADVAIGMRPLLAGSAALTASIVLAGVGAGATPAAAASAASPAPHGTTPRAGTRPASARTLATASTAAAVSTAAVSTAAVSTAPQTPIHEGICMGPPGYRSLESQLSTTIQDALHGRSGDHAVTVYDRVTSVHCTLNGGRHFDSASIVKAIVLAALLRWSQERGTPLTADERSNATLMITQSDNDATTDLWDELGMARLQHFLDLAKMNETELGTDGYWGLTGVTADDEMLLLELLTKENPVLWNSSRAYELDLMARVIDWEAWGVTAGTPSDVTWHVKNGWLPDDAGWHINSIGAFTGDGKDYMIAVLTDDNPSEQYGIDTIENVARPVQEDINAAKPPAKARFAASEARSSAPRSPQPSPSPSPSPWAVVPALPTP